MSELTWVDLVVADAGAELSAWALFTEARGVVLFVLLLLIAASIGTWFVIGVKYKALRTAEEQTRRFLEVFWASKRFDVIDQEAERLPLSPVSKVFRAGFAELRKIKSQESDGTLRQQLGGIENIERALRKATTTEIRQMERMLPFLATVGSTSPFIGLFGTVWGIMLAFMAIARSGEAGIDVVSGPIAEALIATAIGLVAAIPAVMGYNFFNARVRSIAVDMEGFSSDFLNLVKRHFL